MASLQLPMLVAFEFEGHDDVSGRWEKWLSGLLMYLTASGIKDIEQKKATLLYCAGEQVREIYSSLPVPEKGEKEDEFQLVTRTLNCYFEPRKNIVFERHLFFKETMHATESVRSYIVRLRKLAKTCRFETYDSDQAIRDQVVQNCTDNMLCTRFLKDDGLTLDSLSSLAAAYEQARSQAKEITQCGSSGASTGSSVLNAVVGEKDNGNFSCWLRQMEAEINRLKHTERNKSSNTGAQQKCRSCGTQHLNISMPCKR